MFAATRLTRLRHDTSRILSHWILPLGWLALLTGMFWVGDRSDYHRLSISSWRHRRYCT